ncbi:MAG: IS3 family transposase [Candidatus Acididesulfobacter diazotrophicus]|uniref:IS3 family transposase n=1 Tax=Candidatus Acididesulfobacter diazotrophicus TaxID=2597226 RepID=A0A519BKT5_9DELT|nr:MAG: IS3 family transposase [Candidatus Acididesulfobacter diazotrophicus]
MSINHRKFSPDFKAKVVLELLESGKTTNEIATQYKILPKSVQVWRKQFLENASAIYEDSVSSKKYKDELKEKEKKIENLEKTLGRTVMERDWLQKKVGSLGLIKKLSLVEPELPLSITRQCQLLKLNRTTIYYEHAERFLDQIILNRLDEIYTEFPYYGYRRMYHTLIQEGKDTNPKQILNYMKILGIKALYPAKKKNTSIPDANHEKYPYLLKGLKVTKPNQVWASDITYIRLNHGFVYLCAIIDLYTRSILSWSLSPIMDERLTVNVLNNAIHEYGTPEIFNSDQGSQYTAQKFINILVNHNISISMDSKGRALDNIFIERFWKTIKYDNIYPSGYLTIKEAHDGIDAFIHQYNNHRLHSSLGYKPPLKFYSEYFEKAA